MNIKAIKSTLLAAIVTAVLCAGTVSAHQLRSDAKGFACGTTCSVDGPGHFHGCSTGCFCNFFQDGTGFCSRSSQLPQSPGKYSPNIVRKESCMQKTMKTVLFSTMVTAVLGAGTLSARQLRSDTKGFAACKGSCSSTQPCLRAASALSLWNRRLVFARRIQRESSRRQNSWDCFIFPLQACSINKEDEP